MKRRIFTVLSISLMLLLILAVPILAYTYSYNLKVTNTNSAYTNVPFITSMNNTALVSGGFMAANGLDTQVLDGATQLSHLIADDKTLFVGSVPSGEKTFQMTTGNTPASSMPIVVGNGGYVTTADNATLEPRDNFNLELSVYLQNTGTVFEKHDAIKLSYNATTHVLTLITGNNETPSYTLTATGVTAGLHTIKINTSLSGDPGSSVFLYPNGAGDVSDLSTYRSTTSLADWQILSSIDGVDPMDRLEDTTAWLPSADNYLSFPTNTPSSYKSDLYTTNDGSIYAFSSMKIYVIGVCNYPFAYWKPLFKQAGQGVWAGDQSNFYYLGSIDSYYHLGYRYYTLNANPVTGLAWQSNDLSNAQFGLSVMKGSWGTHMLAGFAVELIGASANPHLNMFIDNAISPNDSESISSPIPDNASNWVWYPNPYIDYVKLETGN